MSFAESVSLHNRIFCSFSFFSGLDVLWGVFIEVT